MKRALALVALLGLAGSARGDSLNFDLTSGVLPSNLSVTRSGGTFYLQNGVCTSIPCVYSTTDAALFEARDDGAGYGLWNFGAYSNDNAAPFNMTGGQGGWTTGSGGSATANDATSPDGTSTATRLSDNSASLHPIFSNIGSTSPSSVTTNVASVWVKQYATSPPTLGGGMSPTTGGYTGFGVPSFVDSTFGIRWRRISMGLIKAAASGGSSIVILPAIQSTPLQPLLVPTTLTSVGDSPTGSIEAWGAQSTQAEGDVPLMTGTTTATTIQPSGSLAAMMQPASSDLNMRICWLSDPVVEGFNVARTLYPLTFTTSDGESNLNFSSQGAVFTAKLNGSNVIQKNIVTLQNYATLEECVQLFSIASKNQSAGELWINGVRIGGSSSNRQTAKTMHTPSSLYIGSHNGDANTYWWRRYTTINLVETLDPDRGEGVIIGDSETAAYQGISSTAPFIYSPMEARTRPGIVMLATPGDTFTNQYSYWTNTSYCQQRGSANLKWVIIAGLGINDATASADTICTNANTMIADINTQNPTAKILLYPPIPVSGFLSAPSQANLSQWRKIILGTATGNTCSITGSNIIYGHGRAGWTELDNGSDALNALCDSGDHLHVNNYCRQYIMAPTYRRDLQAAGLL